MKIVVTGALGHIGSRLIRALPAFLRDAEIILVDNLSTQRYTSLFNLPGDGQYRFVEADLLTAELEPLIDQADVAIHLAALTDAEASVRDKDRVQRENYTATRRVAEASIRTGTAMLFPSTTSVYGPQESRVDEDCSADELNPQSPYAETKLNEEQLLRSLADAEGLRMVVCRLGTIVGPSPGMRFHTAVNKFCWQAVMGQPLSVWRTAQHQVRPYLDLEDAVRVVGFILQRQLFDGRVYNVVTENLALEDITRMIRSYVADLTVQLVDSPIMNQLSYEVSAERLGSKGFHCQGTIDRGISETIEMLRHCASARQQRNDEGSLKAE